MTNLILRVGPLLFILFIDYLVQLLSFADRLIYADDLKVFYLVTCLNYMINVNNLAA